VAHTAVQRFYRHQACIYNLSRWTILRGRRGAVAALDVRPDSRVLEIGCGTGLNFDCVAALLDPARGRLVGVDFSEPMLRRARRRVLRHGWSHVDLIVADATRLELGGRFDRVLFGYSLAMIPDWNAAIAAAVRHLVPGGRLVVLEFGRFDQWGLLGTMVRGYLRVNHVYCDQPFAEGLRPHFSEFEIRPWLGGYNFIAAGVK